MMARSSAKARSPARGVKLGQERVEVSAPCGRSGWRASCTFCHGVSLAKVWRSRRVAFASSPDLVGDVDVAAGGEMAQLVDLRLELGERLLEFEEVPHQRAPPLRASG